MERVNYSRISKSSNNCHMKCLYPYNLEVYTGSIPTNGL